MSDIVIYSKLQRLIVDPPSRTVSVVPAGNVTKEAMDMAIATAVTAASASSPKGVLKLHTLATAFVTVAPHTTMQDEGLTCTITELPNRLLRVQFTVSPYASGGVQPIQYQLMRSGVIQKIFGIPQEAVSPSFSHHITYTLFYNTGGGGSNVVWKLQVKAVSANTAINSYAGAVEPRQLMIEDIGPTPT